MQKQFQNNIAITKNSKRKKNTFRPQKLQTKSSLSRALKVTTFGSFGTVFVLFSKSFREKAQVLYLLKIPVDNFTGDVQGLKKIF